VDEMKAFLMTWKKENEPIDLDSYIEELNSGEKPTLKWRCKSHQKAKIGHAAYLYKQGKSPNGVFGRGTIISKPEKIKGKGSWKVGIKMETLVNPDRKILISKDKLKEIGISDGILHNQASGIEIPSEYINTLKKLTSPKMGRIFGHIDGYPEGSTFESRKLLSECGVHRPIEAGICGGANEGAESIVLSGGYEDDVDKGNEIIYTGHGGQDRESNTRKQTADQKLTRQNLAIAKSKMLGLPIRVIRGHNSHSRNPQQRMTSHYPEEGYRYAGLFYVDDYWIEQGRSGFKIVRFKLIKANDPYQLTMNTSDHDQGTEPSGNQTPSRKEITTQRVVRDIRLAKKIKQLYHHRCQVCNIVLEGSAGPYAEAAHIKPLGSPHNGPDTFDNLLCLCPNHHFLFDNGGFVVDKNMNLVGIDGELTVHPRHKINIKYFQYHKEHYQID
jgi:putative restriction endonuclease